MSPCPHPLHQRLDSLDGRNVLLGCRVVKGTGREEEDWAFSEFTGVALHEPLRRPVPPGGVQRTSDHHRLVLIEPLDLVGRDRSTWRPSSRRSVATISAIPL